MFQKRKDLVAALVDAKRVVTFTDGYAIVPTRQDFARAIAEAFEARGTFDPGVGAGYVTTLEVKEVLREKGFYAVQALVSAEMHKLVNQKVLWSLDLGPFHAFYMGIGWDVYLRTVGTEDLFII